MLLMIQKSKFNEKKKVHEIIQINMLSSFSSGMLGWWGEELMI